GVPVWSPPCAPPVSIDGDWPRPKLLKLPSGGGTFVSSGGSGAYSSVVDGLVCGRLSALGNTTSAITSPTINSKSGSAFLAFCEPPRLAKTTVPMRGDPTKRQVRSRFRQNQRPTLRRNGTTKTGE